MKLGNDRGHHVQYFRFSGIWNVSPVICQDSLKQSRDEVLVDHVKIISFLNVSVDELQNFLLDGSKAPNFRHLGCNQTFPLYCIVNESTTCAIHIQHVHVDLANLWIEVGTYRCASGDVSFHDIANHLDRVGILQRGRILMCLCDDLIPLIYVSNGQAVRIEVTLTAAFGNSIKFSINFRCSASRPWALIMFPHAS